MKRVNMAIVALIFAMSPVVAATAELPLEVRRVLEYRKLPPESLSIYVEDLATGDSVLDWRSEEARNPASVMKLLTTLAALDVLGPAYHWETRMYLLGEVNEGVLDGDLLVEGTGDPFLVTERFWQLLRDLRHAGLREIRGDLILDDDYFDVPWEDPAAFDREPLRAYNVAPNALLANFKVVRYVFTPSASPGQVDVRVEPPLPALSVQNRLRLSPGICRGYQRGITITMNDSLDEVTFSGRFPSGCDAYSMDRTVLGHNEFTASLFQALWHESGGTFSGSWRKGDAGEDLEPDIVFRSMSLADVIGRVNKHSNNVMARQLLYTMGAEVFGAPGTEEKGVRATIEWLEAQGIEAPGLHLHNGAGLSREARITAQTLAAMLKRGFESRYMPEYLSSMSLSGLDGTMRRRFRDRDIRGRAHMKTGSIDHVSAIAGYFQARSGRRFVVAVMQNYQDVHRGPGDEVQSALMTWLNRL